MFELKHPHSPIIVPTHAHGMNNCVHIYSFHLSLESRVTVKVSSLPPQTTTDEIEAYFEKQGDNIEVLSTVNLGNGNAKVELSGINSEGIHYITHSGCEMHAVVCINQICVLEVSQFYHLIHMIKIIPQHSNGEFT